MSVGFQQSFQHLRFASVTIIILNKHSNYLFFKILRNFVKLMNNYALSTLKTFIAFRFMVVCL